MNILPKAFAAIAGLVLLLFILSLSVSSSKHMPEYAQVYLDDKARVYSAPPYVIDTSGLRISSAAEAYRLGYKPDNASRENGAFFQEGRSLFGTLLEKLGVFEVIPSRWDNDGSWNY